MSKLKTLLLTTVSLVAIFFLVACSQTKTTNLQLFEETGSDTRIILQYQGDRVVKQTLSSTLLFEPLGIDADLAKDIYSDVPNEFKDVEGITHKAEFKDDRMVQTIDMDFTKVDLEKITKLLNIKEETDGKYISYKKVIKYYKDAGFKEVKDGKFQELSK